MFPPDRIVCPTEESVETFYLPGEEERIVGISGYLGPPRLTQARCRNKLLHRRSLAPGDGRRL